MGNVVELRKKEIEEVAEQRQQTDLPKFIQYVEPSSLVEHEEAHRIPEMNPEEWLNFFESVRTRNQIIEPLSVTSDGRVYDGRHRLRAAKELGLRFVPAIFHSIDEEEVLQRMADSAILRRSLTKGQRAAIILEFNEMVEELRKEAGENRGTRTDLSSDLKISCTTKEVMESLSEKTGVGKTSIYLLQAVQRDAPDLFELVKAGEMSINKAYTTKKDREQGEGEAVKPAKKPTKERLTKVAKAVETENKVIPIDETVSPIAPVNILRDRVNTRIPHFVLECVHDYELLQQADEVTLAGYTNQLRSVVEGGLLLLEEFETDKKRRAFFEVLSRMFLLSKDDKKLDEFIKNIGGLLNEGK